MILQKQEDAMYSSEFKRILDASKSNSLTFFVGAGVSALSDAPKWSELIDSFCKELKRPTKKYSSDEYLSIPQMYYYSIDKDKEKYYEFINNCFAQKQLSPNIIHKMMYDLRPHSFITTNFDDLLEDAAVENSQSFISVAQDKEISNINGNNFILKLHGDLKHKNIILKEEDYLNYSETFKLTETLLKSIFATNTVVFIGYSLNDYNIKLILNWTKTLLKDKFNKPIFIYVDPSDLSPEELKYHESKGLSLIDSKKCSEVLFEEDDYLGRYKCVLSTINNYSEISIDGKNDIEVFDVLYNLLKPLDNFKALRINDVRKVLSKYIIIDEQGVIKASLQNPILIEFFRKINDMDNEEYNKLPKETLSKYVTILNVFAKANIRVIEYEKKRIKIKNSEYPFADTNCILFDYSKMLAYTNKEYTDYQSNYKKAYYLAKLQKHDHSYNLFTEVAVASFKQENYLLHYLSQANRDTLYSAIKSINNQIFYYKQYDIDELKGGAINPNDFKKTFENLPTDFQYQYEDFKELVSANMLYENSYFSFVDGEKLKKSIESNSVEWGLTSGDKVISRINNNLHFFLGNGLYAEEFAEFKNSIKNLMSLLVYKYATQNKKGFNDELFGNRDSNKIVFDEVDFYCLVEYFSDDELNKLFDKHNIDKIEFNNKDRIQTAVFNLIHYYDILSNSSSSSLERNTFELKIKKVLQILRRVDVSQDLIDGICSFIFKYEFREILISDKILFLDSQIYKKQMYSDVVSGIIEEKLFYYMDKHIKAIETEQSFELLSHVSNINYCNLIHYISPDKNLNSRKRLSIRVNKIINNSYTPMTEDITNHYYEYLSERQKKSVIEWMNKRLIESFNFDEFMFLINSQVKIEPKIVSTLIKHLKLQCNKKDNDTGVHTYPKHEPLEDLNLVGFLCLIGVLNKKRFKRFVNQSDKFDFFYKYDKFDFNKFDVSWLLSCTPFMLEKISDNVKVKDKIRRILLAEIETEHLNASTQKALIKILTKHFN